MVLFSDKDLCPKMTKNRLNSGFFVYRPMGNTKNGVQSTEIMQPLQTDGGGQMEVTEDHEVQ